MVPPVLDPPGERVIAEVAFVRQAAGRAGLLEVTVSKDDASLRVLMRHRAVLFGLLGVALIVSAFVPGWRLPLALLGLASMVSFIVLAYLEGGGNAAIRRVVRADLIASLPLAAALLWGLR